MYMNVKYIVVDYYSSFVVCVCWGSAKWWGAGWGGRRGTLFENKTHTEQANHEQNQKHERKQQQKQETRTNKQK